MSRSPSTRVRLAAAAALCVTPLGVVEATRHAPARVFLLVAALVLAGCAARTRTPATRRAARAATAGIGVAAALEAAHGPSLALVCAGLALALTAPAVWRRHRPEPGQRPA